MFDILKGGVESTMHMSEVPICEQIFWRRNGIVRMRKDFVSPGLESILFSPVLWKSSNSCPWPYIKSSGAYSES